MRRLEQRGALETAHRTLQICGQVFRYAVATGRAKRDPSSDLRGALPPVKRTHFAALTDSKQVGPLLRAMDGYQGTLIVRCAVASSSDFRTGLGLRPQSLRYLAYPEPAAGVLSQGSVSRKVHNAPRPNVTTAQAAG